MSVSSRWTMASRGMPRSRWTASISPLLSVGGRSIWVMSPVTMIFEFIPIRVRNIFICETVAF